MIHYQSPTNARSLYREHHGDNRVVNGSPISRSLQESATDPLPQTVPFVSPSTKVLAVVAHPDDETLGCGGALAKFASIGCPVRIVLPLRRCDPRGRANWGLLLDAFKKSCSILGAEPVIIDPLLDQTKAETHVHDLHDIILPHVEWGDLILTHWHGDTNQVHRGLSRAVEIATRPFRRRKNVLLFEVPTSTDQSFTCSFWPNMYVLLEPEHIEKKLRAMELYGLEMAPGREIEDLRRKTQIRGCEVGVEYAEAFTLARAYC